MSHQQVAAATCEEHEHQHQLPDARLMRAPLHAPTRLGDSFADAKCSLTMARTSHRNGDGQDDRLGHRA